MMIIVGVCIAGSWCAGAQYVLWELLSSEHGRSVGEGSVPGFNPGFRDTDWQRFASGGAGGGVSSQTPITARDVSGVRQRETEGNRQ